MKKLSLFSFALFFILSALAFTQDEKSEIKPVSKIFNNYMDMKNAVKSVVYSAHNAGVGYSRGTYNFIDDGEVDRGHNECRMLRPSVRLIKTGNGEVSIDSCYMFMPYADYVPDSNSHRFLNEIRSPVDNKTVALEYGPADRIFRKDSVDERWFDCGESFLIILAEPDRYASKYAPDSLREAVVFVDISSGSVMYEMRYNGRVVGIKYTCVRNHATYERYFR